MPPQKIRRKSSSLFSPVNRQSQFFAPSIQAKLAVKAPGDAHEQEAGSSSLIQREDDPAKTLTEGLEVVGGQLEKNPEFKKWKDEKTEALKKELWDDQPAEFKAGVIGFGLSNLGILGTVFATDPKFRADTIKLLNDQNLALPLSLLPHHEYFPLSSFKYQLPSAEGAPITFDTEFEFKPYFDLMREKWSFIPKTDLSLGLGTSYSESGGFGFSGGSIKLKFGGGIINLEGFLDKPLPPTPMLVSGGNPHEPPVWIMRSLPGQPEEQLPAGSGIFLTVDVMRIPQLWRREEATPGIQRKCTGCEEEEKSIKRKESGDAPSINASPAVEQTLQSSGQPLHTDTRSFMEERFGHDFSQVQVHHDRLAQRSSADINALAFTHKNHIVFGTGQYQPQTDKGKKLLAHELTHVVQQRYGSSPEQGKVQPKLSMTPLLQRNNNTIRRFPEDEGIDSTQTIHDELLAEYINETGTPPELASRFSHDYQIWLAVKSGSNIQFEKPILKRENPLDRLHKGLPTGTTKLLINGNIAGGANLGTQIANIENALNPNDFVFEQRPDGSWKCRVSPVFKIKVSAEITITTLPGSKGWHGKVHADKLGIIHACNGSVPVNLRGKPTDDKYADVVKDSEMDHVNEIERLHNRHFVPYYHKVMALQEFGKSEADAKTALLNKLKPLLNEATLGFSIADIAEARKFDAPGSTHRGKFNVISINNCNPVLVETGQVNPQQIGLQPGNVSVVKPITVNFATANLAVSGKDIKDGGRVIKSFSNQANANTVLKIFQHYGATSLNSIGPFEFLLANGKSPSGVFNGIGHLDIDPEKYQVTISFPNTSDWAISEVKGDQFLPIVDFRNNRDQAYSAVDIMRSFQFTHQHWIGTSGSPEIMFFTVD